MARSVEVVLDESNPSKAWSAAQSAKMGRAFRENSSRIAQGVVASDILVLPADAKAGQLLDVYSRAGGATGRFTVATKESTPGAGAAAVSPTGDIEFAGADGVTDAEVLYMPQEGDSISEVVPVTAGGAGTFLAAKEGMLLLSASLDAAAASPGAKTVVARGTAPGAGEAALDDLGQIAFNAADAGAAVTATVQYIAAPGVGTASDGLGDRLAADLNS